MALTSYGVNANEAVKLWSRKLAREALSRTTVQKFMGESSDSLLQIHTDTSKGPGDRIRTQLRMLLSGDGVSGDGTLEGNEESLTTYTDDIVIDQLRHAVRSGGEMSEQRIPWSVREEAMMGLRDWWADRLDTVFFNHIAGYTPANSSVNLDGNNTITAPDSDHIIRQASEATDDALTVTDGKFGLDMIDEAVTKAKTLSPQIRPIKFEGEDVFVAFLHPYQVRDLRTSTDTGQWLDIQKAAMQGGDVGSNPIFKGSLGMYNNVILHENKRVPQGVTTGGAAVSDVRRAILCGAQSASIAFGQGHSFDNFQWHEELFDYGNQLGVKAGCIYGVKKNVYNSDDFGTIVMSSYAAA